MTFTEIVTEAMSRLNLVGTDATTRIGTAINRHYKRVSSEVGLEAIKFVTRSANTTNGVRTLAFTDIEKIDRIRDATTAASLRFLDEASFHTLKTMQPGSGPPTRWALQSTGAGGDSATVLFDNTPDDEYTMQADGWSSLADLSGGDVPVIPPSFHDILTWYVLAEEYLRKEKIELAKAYETKANDLVRALQFHLADSPTRDTRQGDGVPAGGSGSSGGSGTSIVTVGTWTPAVSGTGGSSGQAYTSRVGRYIKIGTSVTAWGRIVLSALGTVTTDVIITGLPETAALGGVDYAGTVSYWNAMTSSLVFVGLYVGEGNNTAYLVGEEAAATGLRALAQADLSNSTDIMFSVTYEAAA